MTTALTTAKPKTLREYLTAHDHRGDHPNKPERMITVRMPRSLHERLKECAHRERVPMNTLGLAALDAACAEVESKPQQAIKPDAQEAGSR